MAGCGVGLGDHQEMMGLRRQADPHLLAVEHVHVAAPLRAGLHRNHVAARARLGETKGRIFLAEPGAGSDVVSMQASAKRRGDVYVLNGEKMWISLATKAHHFLVVAKTDPAAGHRGLTAFIVTRDMPGLTTGDIHGKLGVRAGSTGWVAMNDVEVPVENRLGEEGEGFYIAMSCLDNGRYTVAAGATGLIRACLEDSI